MKISPSKIAIMINDVAEIKEALKVSDMVSEKQAAELLNIKEVSLKNKVYEKKIPTDLYTVSPVNGERFYFRSKILGLKCLVIALILSSCAIRKQGTIVSHHEKTVMLITDEGDSICWRVRNKPAIGERFWAYFGAHKITKIKAIK